MLNDKPPTVTLGCTCCVESERTLPVWAGVTLYQLLRHMSLQGWLVELAPTVRLWCPICAANCRQPKGVTA